MTPTEFRAARFALGLSVEQLAEHLGVDPRSVRRWQNGHGPIPGPVIIALRLLIQ